MKRREIGYRSYGLELTGPRVPRSCVAILDYYPKSHRLLLSDLCMPGDEESNLDKALLDYFSKQEPVGKSQIFTNAPMSLPPYLAQKMGVHKNLAQEELNWIHQTWTKLKPQPREFIDYVHRPVEVFLRHLCPERFAFADTVGSNQILLALRMMKLKETLKIKSFESSPRASFLRVAKSLKARTFIQQNYSSLTDGLEARRDFMHLIQKKIPELFIFEESLEMLLLHIQAFHAFILALTSHLHAKEYCENPPMDFPKKSHWIWIPRQVIDWNKIV